MYVEKHTQIKLVLTLDHLLSDSGEIHFTLSTLLQFKLNWVLLVILAS